MNSPRVRRTLFEFAGFGFAALAGYLAHPAAAAVVGALYFFNLAYSPKAGP